MPFCINPECSKRQNSDDTLVCQCCGNSLKIRQQYYLIRPLREPRLEFLTEIFEVEDDRADPQRRKVIKVLKSNNNNSKLVGLLKQEAQVLISLSLQQYGGIPQVESDECFSIDIRHPHQRLHCLVMEFIEGQNLENWLRSQGNQPINEHLAWDWLQQIAATLKRVHEQGIVHKDIKPSNIMLRNRQLVLIDFGIVRVVGRGLTGIGTRGYMAPEQSQGGIICPQTDFYALGRTFVFLLTGKHPTEFEEDCQTGQLMWRDSAPQIASEQLKDLIDDLMAQSPNARPQYAEVILERLLQRSPSLGQGLGGRTERDRQVTIQHLYKRSLLLLIAPILLWLGTSVKNIVFNRSSLSDLSIPCYGDSCSGIDPIVTKCRIKHEPDNYQTITTTIGDLMTSKGRVENFNIDLKYSTRCNSTWVELRGDFIADIAGTLVYIEDNQGKKYGQYAVPRIHPYKELVNDMGPGKNKTFFNLFPRQLRACVQTPKKELRCTNFVKP